jgi:hypothetical protein
MSAHATEQTPAIYGLMAEFPDPTSLVLATRKTHEEGYRNMDAYSPFPIHELVDAFDAHDHRVQRNVLVGGLLGMFGGFGLCYWVSTTAYPLNIGGRPFNSWPAFIPVTFELTILFAALTAVLGMLALNGLPRPHHPVFSVPGFELASRDRFFLMLLHYDPRFDADRALATLRATRARSVQEVPHP